ncbi:GNAT family N-acetyltransferase [Streptomyces sp. NPDC097619]|uniref:GNAT family N-acetyltransferase n=1 Tax=Streptomyces sp. NPDC097619 TaxID=3157228 RepID=UPI003320E036
MVFRTARLTVRAFRAADTAVAFALWSDPQVCRFTGDRPAVDPEETAADIRRWRTVALRGPGCGFWAVEAEGAGFLGDVYVRPLDGAPGEHEIGWHLAPAHWGRGYATEAALGAVRYARAAGVGRLVALVAPGHPASARVAEKAGLRFEGRSDRYAPGEPPSEVYALERPGRA